MPAIATLYRHYVDHTMATWAHAGEYTRPADLCAKWSACVARGLPWLVAVADAPSTAVELAVDAEAHWHGEGARLPLPHGCCIGEQRLVGYAYVTEFRPRAGWRTTVEDRWVGAEEGQRGLRCEREGARVLAYVCHSHALAGAHAARAARCHCVHLGVTRDHLSTHARPASVWIV